MLRGFRVLVAFSFRAAPWQAALFFLAGAGMALTIPATRLASKMLVVAAFGGFPSRPLLAVLVLAGVAGIGLINTLYYIDLLFTVAERAGATVDRRLIELTGATPGLAHHERPDYLDRMDLLREERGALAWMTNATVGLL